ncbi:MAG: hypothetical protein V3T05_09815 [Myxococcota bacterium]
MSIASIAAILIGASGPETTAVVGLGDPTTTAPAVARATDDRRRDGEVVLERQELLRRLTGLAKTRVAVVSALEKMLADARDREARFDTTGANALRVEILRVFDRSARPTMALRHIAAVAAQEIAAALLAEGNEAGALLRARETLRRFSSTPLDSARHSPAVQALFARAAQELEEGPSGVLTVLCDEAGTVFADGNALGPIDGRLEHRLPAGPYRVWWIDEDGTSGFPHPVEIHGDGASVTIVAALEQSLALEPVVALRCKNDCGDLLLALGKRLAVDHVVGVYPATAEKVHGLRADVAEGRSDVWGDTDVGGGGGSSNAERGVTTGHRAAFSPLYLVPFGVGQFAQERPIFASAYAAIDGGLLVWHLVAWQRHSKAAGGNDFAREPDLRNRRNLTAVIFYSALAATIAEAVVVGLLTGE